ncbi:MAG: hypothetical protein JW888_07360 [Pirellulales bacterium]|nr:hypothetical protein [Pirellulales bacterium]
MNAYRSGLLALSAICLLLVFSGWVTAGPPTSYFKPGVPDLDQHNPGLLPDNGDYHCSPTAAANSLKWFDGQQGLDVVPDGQTDVGLIGELGTGMGTDKGTWNDDMVKGYRKYLRNHPGGRQWDVKFQGSKYFRGYTVGQNSATVNLDWIKQELAEGEDVTLTVDWYREGPAGTFTPTGGAHSITLDGYTSGTGAGNSSTSDLLIRDPWYAEGIVERDPDSVASGRLVYEYSTGSANLRAEVVGAISVSPKAEVIVVDSFFDIWEYTNPPQMTGMNCLYNSTYSDYVHLGVDLGEVIDTVSLADGELATIDIRDGASNAALTIAFDQNGIFELTTGDGTVIANENDEVQFAYGFGSSEMFPQDHVRAEMWIDRDVLGDYGDFAVDSFFDITYQVDLEGQPQQGGPLGVITLNGQQVTIDPSLDPFPIPDTDGDGNPYEDPYAIEPDPIEELIRSEGIASVPRVPGDANNDGEVNQLDAERLAEYWGQGDATWAMGDFDGDHTVGPRDASIMAANWHYVSPPAGTAVPEPSAIVLLLGLTLGLLPRRRR